VLERRRDALNVARSFCAARIFPGVRRWPRKNPPQMNLDASSFLTSLLVSSVGFVLLSYGRKMARPPHMIAGITLLVFPYFIDNVFFMIAIATLIVVVLWLAARFGW
jgi:hypothetical protein